MNRPPPTDREAPTMTSKTGQRLETLTDGVAALIGSEQWAAMLAAAAKFPSYRGRKQSVADPAAGAAGDPGGRIPALADPRPAGPQGRERHHNPGAVPVPADQNGRGGGSTTPAPPTTAMGRQPARKAPDSCGVCAWRTCSTRYPEIAVPGLSSPASASALSIVAGPRVLRKNRVGRPASSVRPVSR